MSELKLNINSSIFLPTFRPLVNDYSHRYEIYWGGRASGKTYFCVQKLFIKALKEKRFILLMNKQTNKVKDGVWKELKDAISFFKMEEYWTLNKTDCRATCNINGSEIRCLGLDESEKIKGYSNISDVYLDEMTSFSPEDFELIDGTLRSKKYQLPLQLYGSFNPVSKANWVYKYFGFDTGATPSNTLLHHSTYLDNPLAAASDYMESLKVRNPSRYRIEALGEFASLEKLVYTNWTVQEFDHSQIKGKLMIGLDFGFVNDTSALIASVLDEDAKRIYIFKEWGDTNKTNQELAAIIQNLGFAKSTIIADSAEPKSIEELRRAGIAHIKPSVKGPDSILHGIQKIQEYELIVHPACGQVITELENYAWQKDKQSGEYINKPIDKFNHFLDALRYSIQSINKGTLKTVNKSKLGL